MIKVKQLRTADCVVGGFRYAEKKQEVGSLLLGLYDDEGKLDHVGFTSAIPACGAAELTRQLEKLVEPPGFTGSAPGGPSRWNTDRSTGLGAAQGPSSSPRCATTRSPAAASATAPGSCAGGRTRTRSSAPSSSLPPSFGHPSSRSCSADEHAVRAPLIDGLRYAEELIGTGEEEQLIERLSTTWTSRHSASTAGSAIARREASAGATISMTRASRRRSRSGLAATRCATRPPPSPA